MIHIAFVITGLSTGGAEMMLLKLLTHLDKSIFHARVISLTDEGDVGSRIRALDIPVATLNMQAGRPSIVKFLRLYKLLRAQRTDIVQTWMYHADLLGGAAARLARVPHIAWGLRNSNLSNQANLGTRLVAQLCAMLSTKIPHCIISCSSRAAQIHAELGYDAHRMIVIPNGFDLDIFHPDPSSRIRVREALLIDKNAPLVGLIGRWDPQKNHIGFLRAAKLILQSVPEAHFLMAGRNIDEQNSVLTQEIASVGLLSHIHLLGQRSDMPTLMAALDVLALPSDYGEAFPNVLGEAMACGIPCVVTDVGDAGEIVSDTGRVVSPGDMSRLAHHINDILKMSFSQRKALAITARSRVMDKYDIAAVVRQYEHHYQSFIYHN